MIKVDPPEDAHWVNVEKNMEVRGDILCPKCGDLMVPLWYTDELKDPYSGKIEHKLYGYCHTHGLYLKEWVTNDRDWNEGNDT